MKISIDVDVTPRELREFFGLPDVEPLQAEMMAAIGEKMRSGAEGFDPASLMAASLPAHLRNMEALQRAMWSSFTGRDKEAGRGAGRTPDKKGD